MTDMVVNLAAWRERRLPSPKPTIQHHPPTCSGCGEEVIWDCGWLCMVCQVRWSGEANDGEAGTAAAASTAE